VKDTQSLINSCCGTDTFKGSIRSTTKDFTDLSNTIFSSFSYNPDLSCTLAFDGFAFVRIGYINAPWFLSMADTFVGEDRLKTDFTSYGWSVEEIDLGLDGRSYVTVSPDRISGDTAYGVWYSESGRTLWVAVFRDDPTVSTDEIKRTTIALLDHLADVVPPIYPTTTDEPSAPAS